MPSQRLISVSLTLTLACLTLGTSTARVAPLLPEVQKHLNEAHKCIDSGSLDMALAHADLVLLPETVAVSLKFEGVANAQRNDCNRALDAALTSWETSLGNIHFRREDDPTKADVIVRFRPDVRMGKEPVAGFTNWKRSIKVDNAKAVTTSFKADVQIRAKDLDSSPMSFQSMRQETEHEFGHILGLEDSIHMGDLMGALDISHLVNGPRDYEIEAVKTLRDEARQIKADAQARADAKVKQGLTDNT